MGFRCPERQAGVCRIFKQLPLCFHTSSNKRPPYPRNVGPSVQVLLLGRGEAQPPPHLKAGGLSSSPALQMWGGSHFPFTAPLLPKAWCYRDDLSVPRDTPGRGTAKSVVADRTIDLAAFLSQLCEDVPYQHSPGSLENATGHDTSAGWLRRHIPGLGTHYSSWDMAGSCPQKALVKLAA